MANDFGFNIGVLSLIAFIHLSIVFGVLLPWLKLSPTGLWIQLTLNFGAFMIYLNYCLAWKVHPGNPPPQWKPAEVISDEAGTSPRAKKPRYCNKCQAYKPPRTHHCSDCNQCILKMDHHCPWVNNCVGHRNQGHFFRFLAWVVISLSYCLILLVARVASLGASSEAPGGNRTLHALPHKRPNAPLFPDISPWETCFLALDFLFIIPVLFLVGILFFTHVQFVATNTTTIESYEKEKVEKYIAWGRIKPVKFPFHIGIYNNICSVLGNNPLLWLWPQGIQGTGLYFKTNSLDEVIWPPEGISEEEIEKYI